MNASLIDTRLRQKQNEQAEVHVAALRARSQLTVKSCRISEL